jgi:hypothetical protein
MSKNTNSTKPETKTKRNGPGRPKAEIKFPRKAQWTFDDLCEANGVDIVTGKGKIAKLTLRNFLKADRYSKDKAGNFTTNLRRTSKVILVPDASDKLTAPKGEKGLGRKRLVYALRPGAVVTTAPKVAKVKATPAPVAATPAPEPASVDMGTPATPAPVPAAEVPAAEVPATAEAVTA